jgi:hypothetical protein
MRTNVAKVAAEAELMLVPRRRIHLLWIERLLPIYDQRILVPKRRSRRTCNSEALLKQAAGSRDDRSPQAISEQIDFQRERCAYGPVTQSLADERALPFEKGLYVPVGDSFSG